MNTNLVNEERQEARGLDVVQVVPFPRERREHLVQVVEASDLDARVRLEEAQRHPFQDQVDVSDEGRRGVAGGQGARQRLDGLEMLLEVGVEHL